MIKADLLTDRALATIARTTDPAALRRTADNAIRAGNARVKEAALRRLYAVAPNAEPGTLEHDVWQSIHALEGSLREERGKTILLSRTRQMIKRVGEQAAVEGMIAKPASEGYRMLMDRGWPELTFEAVALRHAERFDPALLAAAAARL